MALRAIVLGRADLSGNADGARGFPSAPLHDALDVEAVSTMGLGVNIARLADWAKQIHVHQIGVYRRLPHPFYCGHYGLELEPVLGLGRGRVPQGPSPPLLHDGAEEAEGHE